MRILEFRLVILALTFPFFLTGCVSIGPPFRTLIEQKNLSKNYQITIIQVGKAGDVKGKWWGDEYIGIDISVKNISERYRCLNLANSQLSEAYFVDSLNENDSLRKIYLSDPNRLDEKEFYSLSPGLDLQLFVLDTSILPKSKYYGKDVFPTSTVKGKPVLSAALLASNFGVPMRGPVEYSNNDTGWLAPGETKSVRMIYSIPKGFPFYRLYFKDIFEADFNKD